MPMYAYKCTKCSHKFEEIQKFSDPPVKMCPNCGKTGNVNRLIEGTNFALKGGGWYKDGYRSTRK